jgi:hypothetical protein
MRSWHIGVAFALLILAWCGYWLYASNMVRGAVEGWAAERRAEGDRVEWRSLAVSGFPFRLEVEFTEPAIAVPRLPERPAWRADRLLAIMQPWDFSRVVLELPRRQDVSFVDDAGEQRDGWATLGEGRASLEFGAGGRVRLASAVASDVVGGLDGSERTVAVGRLEAHARPSATADGVADVALAAAGVTLPVAADAVIGPQVERATVDFTLTGPLAPLPIAEAVRHWCGRTARPPPPARPAGRRRPDQRRPARRRARRARPAVGRRRRVARRAHADAGRAPLSRRHPAGGAQVRSAGGRRPKSAAGVSWPASMMP